MAKAVLALLVTVVVSVVIVVIIVGDQILNCCVREATYHLVTSISPSYFFYW